MGGEEPLADWEREFLEKQAAEAEREAAMAEEYKAHVDALLAPIRDEIAELRAEMAKLAAQPSGIISVAGCVCSYTWGSGGIVRNGPRADCPVHGDEDRIRDAMGEAHAHPGRTITR